MTGGRICHRKLCYERTRGDASLRRKSPRREVDAGSQLLLVGRELANDAGPRVKS
jgi:hypothetical protein